MADKTWTAEDVRRWREKQEKNSSESTWTAEDVQRWKEKNTGNTTVKTESTDSVKKDTSIPKLEATKQSATQVRTADSKMSREERKQTRKESKQWLKDYGKKLRNGEISQKQAAKDLMNPDSEYYKMQEAYNATNPLSAFTLGLISGMPFSDLIAENAADKGNLNAELLVKNRDSAKEQNKGATIAGNLAGTAASYTALNPLITKIPGLNKATEKAAEGLSKLPVLRKVGAEPIKNILSDMAVDVGLDTIPMIAKDVQEEKSAVEIAKNTALNIGGNLAANILGEAAPSLLKTIVNKRSNGIKKAAENSLEQATEGIAEKVDDVAKTLPVETKNIDDIGIKNLDNSLKKEDNIIIGGDANEPGELDTRTRNVNKRDAEQPVQGGPETGGALEGKGVLRSKNRGAVPGFRLVSDNSRKQLDAIGVTNNEFRDTTSNPELFSFALEAGKRSNAHGAMVDSHTADDLKKEGALTFLSKDNMAGGAVLPDGNITAVFKNSGSMSKQAAKDIVLTAIENGGDRLDCYGEDLVDMYARMGFEPVAKVRFNRAYAPSDWNYEALGEPYIYVMAHNGDIPDDIVRKMNEGDIKLFSQDDLDSLPEMDYDDAIAYRNSILNERYAAGEVSGNKMDIKNGVTVAPNASAEADPLANVQNAPHSPLIKSLSENYANVNNIQIDSSVQTKLTNLEKQMKKIVNWYGDDATKAEFAEFQNALKQFEETGSIDDFRRVWESADRLDQSMKGKAYTTKDVLNKNGSLKRKGVTYTYGDNVSVEIAMEDAMDAMDELYTMKNTSNNMTEVKPENVPVKTTSDEIPYLRTEGTGNLKEESYSGNIGKGRVENVDETVQNQFIDDPQLYRELSNKETVEKAQQIYDAGNAEGQIYLLLDLKDPAAIPLGNKLVGDMIDQGRHDDAVQLLRSMSSKLRESGQFTQAAAINMMKSDPETALRYAVREIDNLNTAGAKKYKGKWKDFALTDEEIEGFKNIQSGDAEAIKEMYEKIGSRIAKDYPSTMWEKFTELSRISMLLNPRTNIRNVISNAMLQPVRSLTDRVSALGQNAIHLINPDFKVTQSLIGGGKEEKKLATEVWESVKDSLLDGTSRVDNGLKGIEREKQVFKGGLTSKAFDKLFPGAIEKANKAMGKNVDDSLLETARNFTYYLLEKGDEPFVRNNFVNRLASYMKAQGIKNIDEIPADAITLAKDEALKATFKDDNKLTKMLSGIKKNLGKGGEVILPFTKTPANLAMRGIDYSPAGLINTIEQIKNGADAGKVMDDLSKNLTGSAAIYLGYLLAKNGIITGALSSDKDEAAFQKQQGQLAYSIKVGDNYYNYDWAQPAAIPIILGASIAQGIEESDKEEKTALEKIEGWANIAKQAATSAADTWVELSPLQTVSDLFNTGYGNGIAENVANEFLEFPQRLIPSALGATARTIDTTQRQTYSAENPIKTQIDTAKSKIPFLSKTLPAAYDTWGNEIKRSDSIGEAALAQYVSPGQLGNSAETPIDSEIQRLYDSTENSAVFPRKSAWTVDGKKLDNKQYSDLQKAQGTYSYDLASEIIGDSNYKKMDDSEKADLLSSAYSFAKSMAENKVVGKSIPKAREKEVEIYKEQGVSGLAAWYILKSSSDADRNGSITQEEAKAALDSSNLSNLQKAYFWQMFNSSWKADKNPYK